MGKQTTSERLPKRIVVRDCALTLDGGTIHLIATDETGFEFSIVLVQHVLPYGGRSLGIAGRLYFGPLLVPVRSELEDRVLLLLTEATVEAPSLPPPGSGRQMAIIGEDIKQFFARTPEENCRAFIREMVEFVQSEHYVALAAETEPETPDESGDEESYVRSGKKKRRKWQRHRHRRS
jgi:hypothetical protein